ncbi:hypothetical protein K470DRAFT_263478 [Piedraia hortae CBS 480.64]|uniref:Uncharacterized protein n=1 Tax=Piedraia hortae CBS 480.64 TaxID=1314780 RepID=A0A6A7C2P5_9PEZI|nr:hypothetical protein K470DRAFT_263478 [Piedraia hortae CBS 480.64]
MFTWPFRRTRKRDNAHCPPFAAGPAIVTTTATEATPAATPETLSTSLHRRLSKRDSWRWWSRSPSAEMTEQRVNLSPRRRSVENVTALPTYRLTADTSPHLRPVGAEWPHKRTNKAAAADANTGLPTPPQSRQSNGRIVRKLSKRRPDTQQSSASAPIPIPKRPGEAPSRMTSKKRWQQGNRDSAASLPPVDSVRTSVHGAEPRVWAVGGLDMFSPRPAVRLSGSYHNLMSRSNSHSASTNRGLKTKRSAMSELSKRHQRIGKQADELSATELRTLMERDARRKERPQSEHVKPPEHDLQQRKERPASQASMHPALRNSVNVGLRIDASSGTVKHEPESSRFSSGPDATTRRSQPTLDGALPEVETESLPTVQLQTSPKYPFPPKPATNIPCISSSLGRDQLQPLPIVPRSSSTSRERRTSPWGSLFRRGSNMFRKSATESMSEGSFSNTSREAMRMQPRPTHLLDAQPYKPPSSSIRTHSRFREELPELPSPPDSRIPSPDLASAVTRKSPSRIEAVQTTQLLDNSRADNPHVRSDTPISPVTFDQELETSFGSLDSEGSWLASSSRQQSGKAGLRKRYDSLNKHQHEAAMGREQSSEFLDRRKSSPTIYTHGHQHRRNSPPMYNHVEHHQPTIVPHESRIRSRQCLVADIFDEIDALEELEGENAGGAEPMVQLGRARSVKVDLGHARQVSAGSARLLDIPPSSKRCSTGSSSYSRTESQ